MMPKLIIFDLDGTLAESKEALTAEMAAKLAELLEHTKVAITSGGALPQFLKQVVDRLPKQANLHNLYLLPTSGAALYEYDPSTPLGASWKKVYEERLKDTEVKEVEAALRAAAEETGLIHWNEKSWGERIENRGSQVTMSALGQQAPLALKKQWDPDHAKRHALRDAAARRLPAFEVAIGGSTSIDVSKKGIDKAYGIHKLCDRLGIKESEALYVGDELESGGNDEPVFKTDVSTRAVALPDDTLALIDGLLKTE